MTQESLPQPHQPDEAVPDTRYGLVHMPTPAIIGLGEELWDNYERTKLPLKEVLVNGVMSRPEDAPIHDLRHDVGLLPSQDLAKAWEVYRALEEDENISSRWLLASNIDQLGAKAGDSFWWVSGTWTNLLMDRHLEVANSAQRALTRAMTDQSLAADDLIGFVRDITYVMWSARESARRYAMQAGVDWQ
jgi:hypothetical protein